MNGIIVDNKVQIAKLQKMYENLRAEMSDVIDSAYHTAVEAEDADTAAELARKLRNKKLSDTDSRMVSDRPGDKTEWANYRQELRDITDQGGFPFYIEWPKSPDDAEPAAENAD